MTGKLSPNLQDWIEARRRLRLTHAHVQMARELGMNPKKLGKLDNRRQEPWNAPLPQFIEMLYLKRFGRERRSPHVVRALYAQQAGVESLRLPGPFLGYSPRHSRVRRESRPLAPLAGLPPSRQ